MVRRKCTVCGVEKDLNADNFAVKRQTKTGFDSTCRTCKQAYDRARYAAKRDQISKQKAEYYRENAERIKAANNARYHRNRGTSQGAI